MGRPRVYTNAEMTAALAATRGMVYLAARRLGCKADTIYRRARASPEVADCLRCQRGEFVDTAELRLYDAVLEGRPWAVAMVLKTLGKDRGYVERAETKDGTDEDVNAAIERELARLAALRQAAAAGAPPAGAPGAGPDPQPPAPACPGLQPPERARDDVGPPSPPGRSDRAVS